MSGNTYKQYNNRVYFFIHKMLLTPIREYMATADLRETGGKQNNNINKITYS